MAYIIMGTDECGMEFRPNFPNFATENEAYQRLSDAREQYAEARSLWVELLRDKDYYMQNRDWDDPYYHEDYY